MGEQREGPGNKKAAVWSNGRAKRFIIGEKKKKTALANQH